MRHLFAFMVVMILSSCASTPKGTIYKVSSDPPSTALADVALMEMQALNPESEFRINGHPGQSERRNPWTGKGQKEIFYRLEEVTASNENKLHTVTFISKNRGPWELEEIEVVTEGMRPLIRSVDE